jgi:hypothetical protein
MTEAKEEVRTTRRMVLRGWRAAAVRMARTPLMAGRRSSVSLLVVV